MPDALLTAHITAGTVGLLLGPLYVAVRRGRPTCGPAYQIAVAAVAVTGAALAVTAWDRLWWLLPVAVATEVSAVVGVRIWRRRRPGWTTWVPHVLGGSYVALVTGVMVAATKNPVFWLLPALVAQGPIAVAKHHLKTAEARAAHRQPVHAP
jgi:hypothetical protein